MEDQVGTLNIEDPPTGIGLDNKVVRDSPYYKGNIEHFRQNLEKIVKLAQSKKIPAIFFKPAGNLKDFTPTCSMHRKTLSKEQENQWGQFFEAGQKAQTAGDFSGALQSYEKAFSLDPTYADLSFRLAQIHRKTGELEKARQLFRQAKDDDCIIVRAPKDIEEIFDKLQKEKRVTVLDAEKLLIAEAPGGILGDPIVEDNVHFSIKGHAILGRALAQEIEERGWIAPKTEWQFNRERSYDEIAAQLGVTNELLFSGFLKCVSYFGSKFDSRILYAQKALAIHPNDPAALRHLAWSYWLQGDKTRALEIYHRLNQIAPAELKKVFQARPEIQKTFSK